MKGKSCATFSTTANSGDEQKKVQILLFRFVIDECEESVLKNLLEPGHSRTETFCNVILRLVDQIFVVAPELRLSCESCHVLRAADGQERNCY